MIHGSLICQSQMTIIWPSADDTLFQRLENAKNTLRNEQKIRKYLNSIILWDFVLFDDSVNQVDETREEKREKNCSTEADKRRSRRNKIADADNCRRFYEAVSDLALSSNDPGLPLERVSIHAYLSMCTYNSCARARKLKIKISILGMKIVDQFSNWPEIPL